MKLSLLNVESPLGRFSPGPFSSFYEHEKFGVFLFPAERIFFDLSANLKVNPLGRSLARSNEISMVLLLGILKLADDFVLPETLVFIAKEK